MRRDEVLGLKWSWIDLERGVLTIPPSAEKSGRVRDELRRTGLPPQAVALLAEQRSALFAEGIRSDHDIRRTVADALLNRIGAPPWIVDHVILGHARPKLLRTYMPTLPLGEAREALQKRGEEIDRIMGVKVTAHGPDAAVSVGLS